MGKWDGGVMGKWDGGVIGEVSARHFFLRQHSFLILDHNVHDVQY